MKKYYDLNICGLKRRLPIVKLSDELTIASFVILGDTEIVETCAKELVKKMPEVDYIMTAEAKGIPLAYEMARELKMKNYIVARKSVKAYMNEPISVSVLSITTSTPQHLFLNKNDAELIKGKNVALVDDVISTGKSIKGLERLAKAAEANVVAKMSILAEGDAADRDDIIYLEELPIF